MGKLNKLRQSASLIELNSGQVWQCLKRKDKQTLFHQRKISGLFFCLYFSFCYHFSLLWLELVIYLARGISRRIFTLMMVGWSLRFSGSDCIYILAHKMVSGLNFTENLFSCSSLLMLSFDLLPMFIFLFFFFNNFQIYK